MAAGRLNILPLHSISISGSLLAHHSGQKQVRHCILPLTLQSPALHMSQYITMKERSHTTYNRKFQSHDGNGQRRIKSKIHIMSVLNKL